MRLLLYFLLLSALVLAPFIVTRRPWALRLWQRLRLFLIIYVVVIVVSAITALVLRWDDFYG